MEPGKMEPGDKLGKTELAEMLGAKEGHTSTVDSGSARVQRRRRVQGGHRSTGRISSARGMTMQGMGRISSMLGRAAREPLPTAGRRRGRQWSPGVDPDLDGAAEGFAAPCQMARWSSGLGLR